MSGARGFIEREIGDGLSIVQWFEIERDVDTASPSIIAGPFSQEGGAFDALPPRDTGDFCITERTAYFNRGRPADLAREVALKQRLVARMEAQS